MVPTHDSRMDLRRGATATVMDDLACKIEKHIVGKAQGRIRDLHVVCVENLIILQGRTRTQHDKQMVQEAACDVMDSQTELANRIVVSC